MRGRLEPGGEDPFELSEVEGFGEVVVHAGGEAAFAVAEESVGGEGDDGRLGGAGADGGSGGEAVHLRHLAVHENEVVGISFGEGYGGGTFGSDVDVATEFFEKEEGEGLVDGVVLGEENADSGEMGAVGVDGGRNGVGGVEEVGYGAEKVFRANERFREDGRKAEAKPFFGVGSAGRSRG